MPSFTDLLGSIMHSGVSQTATTRTTNALGGKEGASALTDILGNLGQVMGGGKTAAGGAGNLGGILGSVLGSLGQNRTAAGGLGALAGAILGGGRKSTRGAIGGGTLAMLASLAFSALQKAGQRPATPPALMEAETSEQQQELENEAALIIKAMINAAKADGKIDREEVEKIVGKLDDDGITQEEKDFFQQEVNKPIDTASIIAAAGSDSNMAAQIYAASLLTIEVDTPAEQEYMQQLANGLKLDTQTVNFIEMTLGVNG